MLPDFIICGAMKSGTTSLHAILNNHPDIYIPESEVHFFDINNIYNHPDFFFCEKGEWCYPRMDNNRNGLWQWYNNFFQDAPKGSLIGEDSTNYLASAESADRIAMQDKQIKCIICLRHPTKRAYSHYWHMLSSGRAIYDFEDSLRYFPESVLSKSMYREQVERYVQKFPKGQLFFFVLEEFLENKGEVIRELSDFLEVDYHKFPAGSLSLHTNKGVVPKFVRMQLLRNRLLRQLGGKHYRKHLSPLIDVSESPAFVPRLFAKVFDTMNPKFEKSPPRMKQTTKVFLDDYFKRELCGLGNLIDKDVESLWFGEASK